MVSKTEHHSDRHVHPPERAAAALCIRDADFSSLRPGVRPSILSAEAAERDGAHHTAPSSSSGDGVASDSDDHGVGGSVL